VPGGDTGDTLTTLLSSVLLDGRGALQTHFMPQNTVLNWLAGNANLESYSGDQKKIIYFSTNGDNWLFKTNWLSDRDKCTGWYHDAEGCSFLHSWQSSW
jgi:hypothetical protein